MLRSDPIPARSHLIISHSVFSSLSKMLDGSPLIVRTGFMMEVRQIMCDDSKCELKGYDAVDIARRMVQLSIEEKIPLTNLKLQKLLYYAWMDYYRENRAFLFGNEIQAWPYGPVVPDAYYEFWTNVSNVIRYTRKPSEEIDLGTDAFLEYVLDEYRAASNTSLKEMTIKRNTPWSMHYVEGRKAEIPFRTMIEMARSCIFYNSGVFYTPGSSCHRGS